MKDPEEPMIPVELALEIVLREALPLPEERIPLADAAGRVLAQEVLSDSDHPPFAKALMDGYALRSADVREVPVELEVVEEIPAGKMPSHAVAAGQAARIMTGAPLPEGADAVQMVEKTGELSRDGHIQILEPVNPGANMAPRGQELKAGQRVLSPGDFLTAARLGVLAGVGCGKATVRRRPRVAVAPTGDELVDYDSVPEDGQIRNSNGVALMAAARTLGAGVSDSGIVRDDATALSECIATGLLSDLLLLSGGVSMGTYDLVERALEMQGVDVFFRKIAIRPGKPTVFGRKGRCLVFGLPGNPVSSLVIFEVLVAPAIRRMQGLPRPEGRFLHATLEATVVQRTGRTAYLPGTLRFVEGSARIRHIPTTGSADLPAYSRADALLILPAGRERVDAGERVEVLVLESSWQASLLG